MPLSLSKGGNVSLSKVAEEAKQPLEKVIVGLGWDARMTDGSAFDLDASAFMLADNGQVRSNDDFIFYNQLQSKDGSVVHSGDNLTGIGEGDDEQVTLDLTKVPADVTRIPFCVTIHEADSRKQNFGMVNSAYIRIINTSNSEEMVRYDLSEDASTETAMIFGELYRHGSEWKFKAIEQGSAGGLGPLAQNYGVNI